MSSKVIKKSTLFRTCNASDVLCAGGQVTIPGLNGAIWKKDITNVSQINYRAEVAQVVTVGGTSYTPASSTIYSVVVYDPLRNPDGYNEAMHKYSIITPTDVTTLGTAAQQREWISLALVAKINADQSNHAVAATVGSGNGFTVTDDGSYYPVFSLGGSIVKGVNSVFTVCNSDGSGYTGLADATPLGNASVTTTGVYSFGVGASLAAEKPIVDFVYGNVVSGYIEDAPLTLAGLPAVSGQNYNGFVIESYKIVDGLTLGGQFVYQVRVNRVFADNGTGSSTTNLAGYKLFERAMHKLMADSYVTDPNAITEFFDKGYVMQANPGVTPYTGTIAGTADVMKFFTTPYGTKLEQYNINAQTIFAPLEVDGGLRIEQDVTATDGAHYCAGTLALAPNSFIVGKQPFMCYARVVAGDWTDAFFMVGFRKKAVYAADYTTYDDLGAIGTQVSAVGDFVATQGNINNGTMKETVSSTVIAADGVSVALMVKVDINGVVTAYRDGVSFPIYSVGTTPLVFDATDEMIPFFQYINLNSSASTLTFSEFIAVATTDLIV